MATVEYDPKTNAFTGESQVGLPQVMWHVTDRCPLSCPYCFATKTELDVRPDSIPALVSKLAQLGVQKIDIGGGEPLVYLNLDSIVTQAELHGIAVTITTSGFGSSEVSDWLVSNANRFARIILSLDGPGVLHDQLRGREGVFDALSILAERLKRHSPDLIRVNTVVTTEFRSETFRSECLTSVRELDPSEWCLIQPHPANQKDEFDLYALDDADFESIVLALGRRSRGDSWTLLQRHRSEYSGYWVLYPDGRLRPHTDGAEDGPGIYLMEETTESARKLFAETQVPLPRPLKDR